jgi:hypothetical protein
MIARNDVRSMLASFTVFAVFWISFPLNRYLVMTWLSSNATATGDEKEREGGGRQGERERDADCGFLSREDIALAFRSIQRDCRYDYVNVQ